MHLALLLTLATLSLLLLTHDLVPLGRWNNLRATTPTRPLPTRLASTLLNSLTGLIPTWLAFHEPVSGRRTILLVLAILLVGELTSWWLPWLTGHPHPSPARLQHLRATTAGTRTLVPERHGLQPNALHTLIHLLTLAAFLLALPRPHA